jgi:hypothetical protein
MAGRNGAKPIVHQNHFKSYGGAILMDAYYVQDESTGKLSLVCETECRMCTEYKTEKLFDRESRHQRDTYWHVFLRATTEFDITHFSPEVQL